MDKEIYLDYKARVEQFQEIAYLSTEMMNTAKEASKIKKLLKADIYIIKL